LNDVIGLAMIKHGCKTYHELEVKVIHYVKPNKSKNKREAQLAKALEPYKTIHKELHNIKYVQQFLNNGEHGILCLKKLFKSYSPLKEYWTKNEHIHDFNMYLYMSSQKISLQNIIQRIKDDVIEYKIQQVRMKEIEAIKESRRTQLQNALKREGLSLRGDSTICSAYINGSESNSIQEIVTIMKEMDFFFKYTEYPSMIRESMRDAYACVRADAYDMYGPDYEDEIDVEQLVDKTNISNSCKERALRKFIRMNPNKLDCIPVSLKTCTFIHSSKRILQHPLSLKCTGSL
jgi:rRNA-processing protein FCF1